jgi:hypothetical protein
VSKKQKRVINPLTERKMSKDMSKLVLQSREARRGAKKAARSGHPGRRAEAQRVLQEIPKFIRTLYVQDARSA